MIAADRPIQRPRDAKLLVVEPDGAIRHRSRSEFVELLQPEDLVIANDAATIPASLAGVHARTGQPVEVRLAGWRSSPDDVSRFAAIVFGEGDYRTRTEHRALPPALLAGDRLILGPLSATVVELLGHPRLAVLHLDGPADVIWAGIAHHGRPIQYAHVSERLAMWDVWTAIAGPPVAFEPPSAGFVLDWQTVDRLHRRGVGFETITHAAGISSTGDDELDLRLPFDEPYRIPVVTAKAIARTRAIGGRIVAIGTTVVRALEHAATRFGRVRAGDGVADERIGPDSQLRVVDVILSGTHEPGTSHYQLLKAFAADAVLAQMDRELEIGGYRTHEFGDSIWVERCYAEARWRSSSFVSRESSSPTNVSAAAVDR